MMIRLVICVILTWRFLKPENKSLYSHHPASNVLGVKLSLKSQPSGSLKSESAVSRDSLATPHQASDIKKRCPLFCYIPEFWELLLQPIMIQ